MFYLSLEKEKGVWGRRTAEAMVKRKRPGQIGRFSDDRVYSPEQGVKVKKEEARDGGRESFSGGGVGGETEGDTSDGFSKCSLTSQLDI